MINSEPNMRNKSSKNIFLDNSLYLTDSSPFIFENFPERKIFPNPCIINYF